MLTLLQEKQQPNSSDKIYEIHEKIGKDLETLNATVDKATEKENIGVLVGTTNIGNDFLKDAVAGTKKRVRSESINKQIEIMKQLRMLKRGLPMKNTKGQEDYGNR